MERELAEGSVAADELRLLIERIERLEEEKKGIADDIGTSMPRPRRAATTPRRCAPIVRLRKMETHDRAGGRGLLETYKARSASVGLTSA